MSNVVYYGLKDNIILTPSEINQTVNELAKITEGLNDHIDRLADLVSPLNPQFNFLFPNYSRPNLPSIDLTQNFDLNTDNIHEVNGLLFIEQIEAFSSYGIKLEETFAQKTLDLPQPLNSPKLWSLNQKVIDSTLSLSQNLPQQVADTSQNNRNKSINRGAFKNFISKMEAWSSKLDKFKGSYTRKFSELNDKLSGAVGNFSVKIEEQNSKISGLDKKINNLMKRVKNQNQGDDGDDDVKIQIAELQKNKNIEKVKLLEMSKPAAKQIQDSLKPLYETQMKFIDINAKSASKIEHFVNESYLNGKPVIPDWSKSKLPVQSTINLASQYAAIPGVGSLNFGSGKQNVLLEEKQYQYIGNLSDGLASVSLKNKWGFVNEKGEVVIPLIYDAVRDFSGGLAVFKLNDKWGFINTKGEQVVPMSYDHIGEFSNGLATVTAKRKCGFVNEKGEEVIELKYDITWGFREGFAGVKLDDKWGHINQKGEVVVPLMYDYVWNFYEGLAWVRLNDKYGFVNTEGKEAISLIYDEAGNFSKGLAPVKLNGKYGFVNLEGKVVIPLQYDGVNSFDEKGLARVELNGGYTFIDQQGKLVASFQKI